MKKQELQALLATPQYSFLRTDPHLGKNIMLLTLGGSHAYGTNVAGSDVDIRGIAYNSRSDLLGLTDFEQVVHTETDTTVYGFRKIIGLLMNCNPNTIEMLGGAPGSYAMMNESGLLLLQNKKLFLSRRAVHSFGGYAIAQLRRLECALAKNRVDDKRKEEFALSSVTRTLREFERQHSALPEGGIRLYIGKGKTEGMETEILVDAQLQGLPLRRFKPMMEALGSTLGQYNTLGKRNTKKDDAHLDKHAMHLIRLYMMCLDILERGEIVTHREKDRVALLEIRGGKYRLPDGTYDPAFFELINEYEQKVDYAAQYTSLPEQPDFDKIQDLVIAINEMALKA